MNAAFNPKLRQRLYIGWENIAMFHVIVVSGRYLQKHIAKRGSCVDVGVWAESAEKRKLMVGCLLSVWLLLEQLRAIPPVTVDNYSSFWKAGGAVRMLVGGQSNV